MNKNEITQMLEGIYVGYNPGATLDTAIGTAGRRFNAKLGTNFNHSQLVKMMEGENVISCGGLDNFLIKLFRKMENKNSVKVA